MLNVAHRLDLGISDEKLLGQIDQIDLRGPLEDVPQNLAHILRKEWVSLFGQRGPLVRPTRPIVQEDRLLFAPRAVVCRVTATLCGLFSRKPCLQEGFRIIGVSEETLGILCPTQGTVHEAVTLLAHQTLEALRVIGMITRKYEDLVILGHLV